MRHTGVTARGIVTPIIKQGDDLVSTVCTALTDAMSNEGFSVNDGDIVAVTEAVVGITQGNYATCEQIASDVKTKFNNQPLGIVFPILSRNRFSVLLKAIAMGTPKLYIQLSFPHDEVGNSLISYELMDEKGVNPYSDSFTEKQFRDIFGNETIHHFTGVDYIEFYKSLGDNIEVVFSNDPRYILNFVDNVLVCDIHTRFRTEKFLKASPKNPTVYRLDNILTESVDGGGYNERFGLLGSNKATEEKVKLFPRATDEFIQKLSAELNRVTGKQVECMVYGDGCFKDPVGGIWEFADPVVSPSYTKRLEGTPNEIKIKYVMDNALADLEGEQLREAMKQKIKEKDKNLFGKMLAQGTTPRRYTDLLGSLSDLISGSGDRGTPVVLIQNYFTNYASE